MRFNFLIISLVLVSGFAGSVFGQELLEEKEFTELEIDDMKHKAVILTMHDGTFFIELYPEDAPNTVYNFLKLVESGYYDGVVFHRIIPDFMIQTGDPNTKNSQLDRSFWGQGGPGYVIGEEFNTLQHDRGMVSMARSNHPDSAGSQFFIVHQDSNFLDGQYTVFGRLAPGTYSDRQLDFVAGLETDGRDAPLDVFSATIKKAQVVDPYSPATALGEAERNVSLIKEATTQSGKVKQYVNNEHKISLYLPYRWTPTDESQDYLHLILEPTEMEHNVQKMIEATGFTPQVLVFSAQRDPTMSNTQIGASVFSIKGGDDPNILSNYIFENSDGRKAHMSMTTQNVPSSDGETKLQVLQLHFTNSVVDYTIIYVNLSEWFRYEVNAFGQTVKNFEVMIDGKMQPINFYEHSVFKQVIADAREVPPAESLPPARIGGCLIATASYGSELAPQVQLLREIRDNAVLQTQSGASFMTAFNQFYYSFSPTIADYERESPVFKEAIKITLTPLLTSLTLLQYVDIDSEHEMLGYGIGLILLNIGMYFIAPAVLITKIRSFYKLQ